MRIPAINLSAVRKGAEDFARRMRRNVGLRLISVLIAIGLWIFVNAGQRGAVETLSVPLSYRAIPPGLIIVNHPPEFVRVEVTGPHTLLSLLDPERMTLRLDLASVPTGQSDFKLSPGMFNVPRQTNVARIVPDQVHVDVDRIVMRELPVHLNLEGQPASNYEITGVDVTPPIVSVSGPSRDVMALQRVEAEPLELKGDAADVDARLALVTPNQFVHLGTGRIAARLHIGEVITNREFRAIPVEVRDTDFKFRISPQKATVTLRGPVLKLDSLDPKGLVYVDAKGGDPGAHDLPLQVDLPDGMQLVKQNPDKIRLRIYREKRTDLSDGKAS
ncbi:MAG: YbbR-like domain-containing protein [Candidatus Binataceae bacterium]